MRLLHVINSANPRGGGPIEAIHQAVRELSPRGHENEILCVDPPDSAWLSRVGTPVHALGPAWSSYRYSRGIGRWLAANIGRFDAAVVHSLWQHPGHELWKAAMRAKVPFFVYTHGSLDPAHRRVFWMKHPQKVAMWLFRERRFLEDARAVLYTCEDERDLALHSFWPGLTGSNSEILPYCTGEPPSNTEEQMAAFRAKFPQLTNQPFLLFLSRLHPKKGPDLLLSAFAETGSHLQDHFLVMAGPGTDSYAARLKRMAESLGIANRILWPGMLSGDLKWGAFRCADAFVLCSHQENFGIAVVESLACGLPVLTTDRVNIWKTISDGGAGFIGTDTAASCADLLMRWATLSLSERDLMRQKARTCFGVHYSAAHAADLLLRVFADRGVAL